MKTFKLLSLVLLCFLSIGTAQAGGGCTPDQTCTGDPAAICPTTLAVATVGTFYSQTITFYFPDTIEVNVPVLGNVQAVVTSVEVEVEDLPTGLTFDCGVPNCVYNVTPSNRYGCGIIQGIPCEVADTFNFTLNLTPTGSVIGSPIPISGTAPFAIPLPAQIIITGNLPQLNILPVSNTQYLCPTGNGSTIDLEATAGFDSYAWSTGDTDSIITASATGTYTVSATHSSSCVIQDSIELFNLNATVTNDTVICANTFFELNAAGGDFYNWSPSANLSEQFVNDPLILRGLTADQTFQVVVSNGFCSDTAEVEITIDTDCGLGICASCVLDTVGCAGNIPAVCQQLPVAIAGEDYEESFSFFFPSVFDLKAILPQAIKDLIQDQGGAVGIDTNSLPAFPVNEFYIELTDLPTGFSWESDQSGNGNFYFPNKHSSAQYGCVSVCGNSCDAAGDYLNFVVFAEAPQSILGVINLIAPLAGTFGITLPITVQGDYLGIPVPITSLTFEYETPLVITAPVTTIEDGDTISLSANGGFSDYTWSTGETTATIDVTAPGTYTVSATDANGCVQVTEVEVTQFISVDELNAFEQSLNIFPNPNTGNFNVSFTLAQNQEIAFEVINLQGKVVSSQNIQATAGSNNLPVNLSTVAKGIYFVKIQTVDGAITRRVSVH